jgi:hypothetical protein
MSVRGVLRKHESLVFVRNIDLGSLQETFLVTGVTTVLIIRTQLWLTNYPQLGGHGLHIAHLLWGGLFMVIAIGLSITFVGRPIRRPVAVIGGVGFGFFIDELGKFITSDNSYFYKPAAALIYLIFLGLFMLARAIREHSGFSSVEYVTNAIDVVGEAVRRDLDENERRRALGMLDRAKQEDPLVAPLRSLLEELPARPPRRPSWFARMLAAGRGAYFRLVGWPRFRGAVGLLFALWSLATVVAVFELVLSAGLTLGGAHSGFAEDNLSHLSFVNIASLCSSLVSAVLVAQGIRVLHTGKRLHAYEWFERALLVSIFVTQVFSFVESQFGAVFGLGIDLVLLVTLRYVMHSERSSAATAAPAAYEAAAV